MLICIAISMLYIVCEICACCQSRINVGLIVTWLATAKNAGSQTHDNGKVWFVVENHLRIDIRCQTTSRYLVTENRCRHFVVSQQRCYWFCGPPHVFVCLQGICVGIRDHCPTRHRTRKMPMPCWRSWKFFSSLSDRWVPARKPSH